VVGLDSSEGSVRASRMAARLAVDLGAQVVAVHATLSSSGGRPGREQLSCWCRPLTEAGVLERTVVQDDTAVRLLHRVAEIENAYLIVVGSSERSELGEFLTGSVVADLAHHGNRPLVIVPTPDSEIVMG